MPRTLSHLLAVMMILISMSDYFNTTVIALTVSNYPQPPCMGSPITTPIPTDTCVPTHYQNFSSLEFIVPRTLTPVATMLYGPGPECKTGLPASVVCNKCVSNGNPKAAFYQYTCNSEREFVLIDDDCPDASCTNCGKTANVSLGQCFDFSGLSSLQGSPKRRWWRRNSL